MKTNGDVLREKLSKMSDDKLIEVIACGDIDSILGIKINCKEGEKCKGCKGEFFSQPYENLKRWYLHRYSTSEKCEIFYGKAIKTKTSFSCTKYTFEEACKLRTELNKDRESKKNLWLIAEEKENKR